MPRPPPATSTATAISTSSSARAHTAAQCLYQNRAGRFARPPLSATDSSSRPEWPGPDRRISALGDLDDDGDLDLLRGSYPGNYFYYENTGSATRFAFAPRTGAANPLDGVFHGPWSTPALGDLDADGDLDLLAGDLNGGFSYFRNSGSASNPVFAVQTGSANPLNGQDVGDASTAALADLDADGDLDFFSGSQAGSFFYFENTGTPSAAVFVPRTGASNPLAALGGGTFGRVGFADFDTDGDLDALASLGVADVRYFENIGKSEVSLFVARTGSAIRSCQQAPVFLAPAERSAAEGRSRRDRWQRSHFLREPPPPP